jgi:iron complex outermembrane recepter protein
MACCAWLLIASSSPFAAQPGARTFPIDIPSTSIDRAVEALARQTGASIGMNGRMPAVNTRAVQGQMTALAALQGMLDGSNLTVVEIAPLAFRLESVRPESGFTQPGGEVASLDEVVVTGTKRAQDWFTSPSPISVLGTGGSELVAPLIGTRAALQDSASMSSTNLGPGRNRQFIRGIADSAFNGPSQSTVSVHVDEARVTFDAPDPDLRQVDVARIEILKGPQGPLYGTGALGGIYHIVTSRPDLEESTANATVYGSALASSGAGGGASVVINAPLREQQLGLRAVAYAGQEPGWIDNLDGRHDANSAQVVGGRLALQARTHDWTIDLSGAAQAVQVDDSQYLLAGSKGYQRAGITPEPHDGDFYMGLLTATGRMGAVDVLMTASSVYQEVGSLLDATAAAPQFGLQGRVGYEEMRTFHLMNQELRISGGNGTRWQWLAGAALMSARSHQDGTLEPEAGASIPEVLLAQHAQEIAAFGELRAGVVSGVHVTAGLRVASTRIEGELAGEGGDDAISSSDISVTPSIAFDWQPGDANQFYYFRYARAERPGGLAPSTSEEASTFKADDLSSFNLGSRLKLRDATLTIDTALFAGQWRNIQSDYLLSNGIVATHNVGDGQNFGWEGTLRWRPDVPWIIDGDATLQRARLTHPEIDVADDPRLPVVPDVRLRAMLGRKFEWGEWTGLLSGEAAYTGPSRLSFEEALDRKMGGFSTLALALGLTRPGWSLLVRVDNATNSHGNTFAFGNPFSVRLVEQHTPLQPRTLTLSLNHSFER